MRRLLVIGPVSLALLGGCTREPALANEVDIANAADAARGSVDNYAALPRPATRRAKPAANAAALISDTTAAAGQASQTAPGSDDSAPAAAAVLTQYYSLIGEGCYAQAWRLWDQDGQASGMDEQSFGASFEKYATYRAAVGAPGRIDAGAGQRYVTVPVRITGTLKDGDRPVAMEGPVTLHRVADIDGATPEQRRWRISASGVRPRPGSLPSTIPTTETPDAGRR